MRTESLLEAYDALAEAMALMLAAAQQGNWEMVSDLEQRYLAKMNSIKTLEKATVLTQEIKTQKTAIIQRILADDHQLRLLIHPWMQKLNQLMQPGSPATRRQAKLNSAYQM